MNCFGRLLRSFGSRTVNQNRRTLKTIVVEGNVGSGKTSLINHFIDRYKPHVFGYPEPVEKWRDLHGHNMLGLMYSDPKRWSFVFQQYVQLTMSELHRARPPLSIEDDLAIKLMERSIYSARYCFVETLVTNDLMSVEERLVYEEWFRSLSAQSSMQVDLIVYLRTSPSTCYERIKKRCRPEEQTIPLTYLQQLHECHDRWLLTDDEQKKTRPTVVTLENDKQMTADELDQLFDQIAPFLFGEKMVPTSNVC